MTSPCAHLPFSVTIAFIVSVCTASTQDAPVPDTSYFAHLSPFGIGACNQTSQHLPKWIPQMAKIGIHVMRTCRPFWGSVEPDEGKWSWDTLDQQMNYLTENQIQ